MAPTTRSNNLNLSFRTLFIDLLAGAVFVIFNFTGFLHDYANHLQTRFLTNTINTCAYFPDYFYGLFGESNQLLFEHALQWSVYGLMGFFFLSVLLSFYHQQSHLFMGTIGAFTTGFFSVGIMGWLIKIAGWLIWLIMQIMSIIGKIFGWFQYFFAWFFKLIPPWLWYTFGGIIGLVVLFGIIAALWESRKELNYKLLGAMGVIVALGYFGRSIFVYIWQHILFPVFQFLGMVFSFLGKVFIFVFKGLFNILLYLGIVALMVGIGALFGHLVMDQLKAAWNSGQGFKGIIAGSFGLGIALSLVVLVCIANPDVVASISKILSSTVISMYIISLPAAHLAFYQKVLVSQIFPLFDVLIFAAAVLIGIFGLLRGFQENRENEFRVTFIGKEAAILALGVPIAVIVLVFVALSGGGSDS